MQRSFIGCESFSAPFLSQCHFCLLQSLKPQSGGKKGTESSVVSSEERGRRASKDRCFSLETSRMYYPAPNHPLPLVIFSLFPTPSKEGGGESGTVMWLVAFCFNPLLTLLSFLLFSSLSMQHFPPEYPLIKSIRLLFLVFLTMFTHLTVYSSRGRWGLQREEAYSSELPSILLPCFPFLSSAFEPCLDSHIHWWLLLQDGCICATTAPIASIC